MKNNRITKILGIVVFSFLLTNYAYSASITDELSKLNDLYKEGAITEEEFSKAKYILLNNESEKIIDIDSIKALLNKSLERASDNSITNDNNLEKNKSLDTSGLTLSEEDALKAQIFSCWSVPIGLPFSEDLIIRVKLNLKSDGFIEKLEILDQDKINAPGKEHLRILADSVKRAIKLCNPLKVPDRGHERWKELILNFDARDMLGG
tara:strand:+ start:4224 stop:4844 length:621 start_codon:yes stop_codon:yes gene_type:complete